MLPLEIDRERGWLFSSSSDSTVRIWTTRVPATTSSLRTSTPLLATYSHSHIHPHSTRSTLSVVRSVRVASSSRSASGCKRRTTTTTTITATTKPLPLDSHWVSSNQIDRDRDGETGDISLALNRTEWHRFFDNTPRLGFTVPSPAQSQSQSGFSTPAIYSPHASYKFSPKIFYIQPIMGIFIVWPCFLVLSKVHPTDNDKKENAQPDADDGVLLITDSGDESIKICKCSTPQGLVLLVTFECNQGGVLSLVARDGTIYAGCQDGCVAVWDFETKSLVRLIMAQENSDVLAMSMINSDLYTCCANGWIQPPSLFQQEGEKKADRGEIKSTNEWCLITGGNDNDVKVRVIRCYQIWEINSNSTSNAFTASGYLNADGTYMHDPLVKSLASFVSIPSVSNSEQHREDCRQAGIWLKRCLTQLSADAKMIATGQGTNPLALATPCPFESTGTNSYLYRCGVSDNKGPILAVAYAASDLLR